MSDVARFPSIRVTTSLTVRSIWALVAALDDCKTPSACSHGRPVLVSISTDELADRFERDYPGHQGRGERGVPRWLVASSTVASAVVPPG